ncbi:uncharacterized protein LJ264_002097 [Porphyrio hochstetteri]
MPSQVLTVANIPELPVRDGGCPQPPAEHPDRQEPQQEPGAAHDRDDAISGCEEKAEEVSAAVVNVPARGARKHQALGSDAAPGAASAGETRALSSQPAVKRPRSSVLEEEMVQTDEMPCGTPLGNGTLSLWDKTAPCAR